MKRIDCRGLACPAPVLKTKEAIEADRSSAIEVSVDNEASKQNVARFLQSRGYDVSVAEEGSVFQVIGTSRGDSEPDVRGDKAAETEEIKILVLVTSNHMGHGDDELGEKLIISFLKTLKEMGNDLWRLVFLNNGVKLTIERSEVLPMLQDYEEQGLTILVCGTCLTHFNLLEQKRVGVTTNMLDIVTAMQLADKVISV